MSRLKKQKTSVRNDLIEIVTTVFEKDKSNGMTFVADNTDFRHNSHHIA